MLEKMERKLGRFAIPHLIVYVLAGYIIGYLFYFGTQITETNFISLMTLEPYYIVHGFQFWRIITWVMIPPSTNVLFVAIMMFFYYQLGTILEQQWGTFRFNLFIFGGIIFTIIGAFILYGVYGLLSGAQVVGIGNYFSTDYINMSIFLAFALCYPNMEVRLYFIIPIKMKWMAVIYVVIEAFNFIQSGWGGRVALIASLLNVIIFFFATRNYRSIDPREVHRKQAYRKATQQTGRAGQTEQRTYRDGTPIAKHKCAICGRTEVTNPELTFRFCSKCNGNYEYCQDHLFTHRHVE